MTIRSQFPKNVGGVICYYVRHFTSMIAAIWVCLLVCCHRMRLHPSSETPCSGITAASNNLAHISNVLAFIQSEIFYQISLPG